MPTPMNENDVLETLHRGRLVVVPNRRAARLLRYRFDDMQRAEGRRAWDAARVVAWTDWTSSLWAGLTVRGYEDRVLLNAAQEHSIWRELIESTITGRSLSSPDALAEMARSAWSLAAAERVTTRLRGAANTFDSRLFAGWAAQFQAVCTTEGLLPVAEVEVALAAHVRSGGLRLDEPVLLVDFGDLTSAQQLLLNDLRTAGAPVAEGNLVATQPASPVSAVLPSPRDEIVFAARWIREMFDRDRAPRSIAVLTPQIHEERAEIESIFREILAPELQAIGMDDSAAPWDFVEGASLSQQSMIGDALALLHFATEPLSIERFGALLRSPYIGSGDELLPAAKFDAHVLRRGPYIVPEVDLEGAVRLFRRQAWVCPAWLNDLKEKSSDISRGPSARSYGEWAEVIRGLLRAASWPGGRSPSVREFAAANAWDANLDLLATLDFRGGRVTFAAMLKILEYLISSAKINLPSARGPIQIMSPQDAAGTTFDAVVLLHATDEVWPQPARLNPLLGWSLQLEMCMPGTSSARDASRAKAEAELLLRRTSALLALSPAADDRGSLRRSPLLDQLGIPRSSPEDLLKIPPLPSPIEEELAPDDTALPPLPSPELHGGANVLRLQAACGFRAFAEMRLSAAAPEACELGLSAAEQGRLVHRALEHLWTSVSSQSELRALSTDEKGQRIEAALDAAFARLPLPAREWPMAYVRLQRERLRRLIVRWMEFELQRGPFRVRQREERTAIPVGPLRLKVQPDRVDEVEGGVVLVDYKTGYRVSRGNWEGERPDDPQLPLYSLLTEPGQLQGVLFARIRPGSEMEWHGLAADRTVLPTRTRQKLVDLETRREEWQSVLTSLAEDFAAGRADVDPKNIAVTCDNCPQRLLCRVDPVALASAAADEMEQEES